MTTAPYPVGSVSWGTMRSQDLLPAFSDALRGLDPKAYQKLSAPDSDSDLAAWLSTPLAADNDPWWDSEACSFIMEDLFDALDECAPEGHYFGAHPSDGAHFGFWPVEEEE